MHSNKIAQITGLQLQQNYCSNYCRTVPGDHMPSQKASVINEWHLEINTNPLASIWTSRQHFIVLSEGTGSPVVTTSLLRASGTDFNYNCMVFASHLSTLG